jgi:dTDP-4-dehydrorhamnose reductase
MTLRKVLITGGTGQVGLELMRQAWPAYVEPYAPSRQMLDFSSPDSIREAINREAWSCVINSAAYTAVDAAEDNAGLAFEANCQGPAWLAEATAKAGIPLIHLSTDYVFSGEASEAYSEDDPICPIGVYGASKAAGELAVSSANPRTVVIRTAWVLSPHRSNFLKTMLRLASDRPNLRVVADQLGCPTSAGDIANAVMKIALRQIEDPNAPVGTYHFVNCGKASWQELASEILRMSAANGGPSATVEAIGTAEFPTKAKRPANSQLATQKIARDYGIEPRDWRQAVADIIAELGRMENWKEIVR